MNAVAYSPSVVSFQVTHTLCIRFNYIALPTGIGQKLPFEEPGDHFGASLQPIQMCVKSFQRDLQEFRESASVNVTEPVWSNSLLIHSHIVEMYLTKLAFKSPT